MEENLSYLSRDAINNSLLSTTVNIMRACRVMNIYTRLLPHRLLHSDPEDPYD